MHQWIIANTVVETVGQINHKVLNVHQKRKNNNDRKTEKYIEIQKLKLQLIKIDNLLWKWTQKKQAQKHCIASLSADGISSLARLWRGLYLVVQTG